MQPVREMEAAIKRETPLVIIKMLLKKDQLYLLTDKSQMQDTLHIFG